MGCHGSVRNMLVETECCRPCNGKRRSKVRGVVIVYNIGG